MNERESVFTIPPAQRAAFERHYSVKQLAKLWGLGVDVIRGIFAHEEGVVRIAASRNTAQARLCNAPSTRIGVGFELVYGVSFNDIERAAGTVKSDGRQW